MIANKQTLCGKKRDGRFSCFFTPPTNLKTTHTTPPEKKSKSEVWGAIHDNMVLLRAHQRVLSSMRPATTPSLLRRLTLQVGVAASSLARPPPPCAVYVLHVGPDGGR